MGRFDDGLHDVVVDDDAEPVARLQPVDRLLGRRLRDPQLVAGPRARSIDDEREMDRRAPSPARGARRDDLREYEALAVAVRADEPAVEPDVEAGCSRGGHDGSSWSSSRAIVIRRSTALLSDRVS